MMWFLTLGALAGCSPRQVSDSGFGAYEVSLAAWSDGLAVAWYDMRDGNAEVYVRRLDAEGRAAGPELRLTATPAQSYEADIAPLDGAFAVAWYEKEHDGSLHAELGVWTRDGAPLWSLPVAAGGGASRNPIVRSYGDALFCAWIEADPDGREFVWGGWWDLDGKPRGAPVRLGAAGATTWNLNAAITAWGDAWVVFDAEAGTQAEELFLATLARGRATLAQLSADDGVRSKYPDVAFGDSRGAITWFDERDGNQEVYLALGAPDELRSSIEARARRVTSTPGSSIGAYVAWNSDRVGLAWSDDTAGNYEIHFQPFDAAGAPLGAPVKLTDTATHSLIPAIERWRDGFALAWDEIVPGAHGMHDPNTRAEVLFTTVR